MIPAFDQHGYLPAGIHPATLEEVEERFGQGSELRRVQMESLRWLVDLARRAGVQRIIINGSFVTDIMEPNDVDCVLLSGPETARDQALIDEFDEGFPFVQLEILREPEFKKMTDIIFASDRRLVSKGMIEVIL